MLGPQFTPLETTDLNAMHLAVFVRKSLLPSISNVKVRESARARERASKQEREGVDQDGEEHVDEHHPNEEVERNRKRHCQA